ncbi:hypothetical protein HR12_23650 [Microbacterium sp. SUBG005]|nr:hypothetical protein HR12_23650 [Microbacterium sp. SUBG005]
MFALDGLRLGVGARSAVGRLDALGGCAIGRVVGRGRGIRRLIDRVGGRARGRLGIRGVGLDVGRGGIDLGGARVVARVGGLGGGNGSHG